MTGFDKEGFQPDEVPEQSEGNRLTVRIGHWRQPMSKAAVQNKKAAKLVLQDVFGVYQSNSHGIRGQKKMEPMTGFDKEGFQPDEVPEQSEGNRLIVRIASLAAANEQSGGTNSE